MYVYGGHKGMAFFSDLHRFDLEELQWKRMEETCGASGPGPRFGHSALVARDRMWVIGGFCREPSSPLLSAYSFQWNCWSTHDGPPGLRSSLVCRPVCAHHAGYIFVVGLRHDQERSTNVFRYSLESERWAEIACGGVPTMTFCALSMGYSTGAYLPSRHCLVIFVVPPRGSEKPNPGRRRSSVARPHLLQQPDELPVGVFALSFDQLLWTWVPTDGYKLPSVARLSEFKAKYAACSVGDRIILHGGSGPADRVLAALSPTGEFAGLKLCPFGGKPPSAVAHAPAASFQPRLKESSSAGDDEEAERRKTLSAAERRKQYQAPGDRTLKVVDAEAAQKKRSRSIDRRERKPSFWRMVDASADHSGDEDGGRPRPKGSAEDGGGFLVPFCKEYHIPGEMVQATPMVRVRNADEARQWEENFFGFRNKQVIDMYRAAQKAERLQGTAPKESRTLVSLDPSEQGSFRSRAGALEPAEQWSVVPPTGRAPDEVLARWRMGRDVVVPRHCLGSTTTGAAAEPADAEGQFGVDLPPGQRRMSTHWSKLQSFVMHRESSTSDHPDGQPEPAGASGGVSRSSTKATAASKHSSAAALSSPPAPGDVASAQQQHLQATPLPKLLLTPDSKPVVPPLHAAAGSARSLSPAPSGLAPSPPRSPRPPALRAELVTLGPGGPERPRSASRSPGVASISPSRAGDQRTPRRSPIAASGVATIGSCKMRVGAPAEPLPAATSPVLDAPPNSPSSAASGTAGAVYCCPRSWREAWEGLDFGEVPRPPAALRGSTNVTRLSIATLDRGGLLRRRSVAPVDFPAATVPPPPGSAPAAPAGQ
eukprot:TRINITY_DN13169_c2_g3_i1.p1 TRINITY_DN13169_c2_g3~~TRINITY_DN13169_c2_g3_i1.p1  ORF type:complete len:822 (+),score=212.13 TRINITY_DN13169_c2_g3_i1:673-3138(+)